MAKYWLEEKPQACADLGHAQWRLLAQQAGGGFQPALIQVLGRGHVRQLFHVIHELGHSQTAAMGHPRQGPLGGTRCSRSLHRSEKNNSTVRWVLVSD